MGRWLRNETHNEPTTLIIDILLQRRLTQKSGKVGADTLWTNLIIHHGITDILDQTSKLIHILGAFQEPNDFAWLFQWDEVLENIIQFPSQSCTSD